MKTEYIDFLFEITGEDSDLCGERFFVEVKNDSAAFKHAIEIMTENFPYEDWSYLGRYTPDEAECFGYDTF